MAAKKRKKRLLIVDDQPVETDLRYWLIHVLHWHALLIAVIAVILVGMNFFGRT